MFKTSELTNKLRSRDNKRVLEAVGELRVRGWLCDGSLRKIALCQADLQGADLMQADLAHADFHQAHLEYADLSMADLRCAKLTRVNFHGANFSHTRLGSADLYKANLKDARNLTDDQLSQTKRLWGATMPDGKPYDGRFNLTGDLAFARWAKVDVSDPKAMADFYGIALDSYLRGQERAAKSAVVDAA